MNFQNDFAYTTSLNGWEAMSGSNPGALVPITGVFEPADGNLRALTTAAFAVAPPVIDSSPMDVWVDILVETFVQPRTVAAIARLSTTEAIMARVVRNGAGLTFGMFEFKAGAWVGKGSLNFPLPGGPTFRIGILVTDNTVRGIYRGEEVLTFTTTVTAPGRAAVRQEQYLDTNVVDAVGGRVPGAGEEQLVYGTATIDCEYVVLGDLGFTGTRTDRELQWLQSHGATSKSLVTAWDEFLTLQGVPEGSRPGRQYYWLLNILGGVPDLGGDTLIDLWHTFWCVHGGVVGNTQVPTTTDPFFTTEQGVVWVGTPWGSVTHYAEGDCFIVNGGEGLMQSAEWAKVGQAVTFHVRLKEALAIDGTWLMRVTSDDGGASANLGFVNILAGSVYGTAKFTLPSTTGMGYIAMSAESNPPGPVSLYANDFTVDDIASWGVGEITPPNPANTIFRIAGGLLERFAGGTGGLVAPASTQSTDSDITTVIPLASIPTRVDGVRARINAEGNIGVYRTATGVWSLYDFRPPNTWTLFGTSQPQPMPGPNVTVRMVVMGSNVKVYVDGNLAVEGTTTLLGAGRAGFRAGSSLGTVSDDIAVDTLGGVHVESMSALLLEADGGPAQTLDPYFNASAGWNPGGGAVVANNVARFPVGSLNALVSRAVPGVVVGDTVEARVYVAARGAPGLTAQWSNQGADIPLVEGWNAFSFVAVAAGGSPGGIKLLHRGTATVEAVAHFFFAAKVV